MDYFSCINKIVPNAKMKIIDNDYNTIVWSETNTQSKPTLADCETARQEIISEATMKRLREERNIKLLETDKYTSIPDWPHASEEVKQAWVTYRQALRDLPATVVEQNVVLDPDLTNVTWPTPPS